MTSHLKTSPDPQKRNALKSKARAPQLDLVAQRTRLHPMAEATSPPRNPVFRLGGLKSFLPLSDDVVSTRGQALTSLMQSRSSASLQDLRPHVSPRRHSNYRTTDEESDGGLNKVRSAGSGPRDGSDREERRSNAGAQALMMPQMRSMRLIGNSNPRYQWWVLDYEGEGGGGMC